MNHTMNAKIIRYMKYDFYGLRQIVNVILVLKDNKFYNKENEFKHWKYILIENEVYWEKYQRLFPKELRINDNNLPTEE